MDSLKLHKKYTGKLTISSVIKVKDKEMLSTIYTPEVGKVCMAIKARPETLRTYTIAGRTVAVISDGSAVLGFGNIGAKAALPVMEGKAVIFKEFAGLDAYPLCIEEQDTNKFINIVKSIAMNFAAINLEDISAPRCFEIEKRLSEELDIPVMHDDQHGTAIVVLAGLLSALRVTNKKEIKIAMLGVGAAGTAIAKLLMAADKDGLINIREMRLFDSKGLISLDRESLTEEKQLLAGMSEQTETMSFEEGIKGMDVFIGVSVANALSKKNVKSMNIDPIIFALANPTPEIMPEDAYLAGAKIVATGRSDYDNQINNALAYPGMFKGILELGIKKVEMKHKLAVAKALFQYNLENLSENHILPDILDKKVVGQIVETLRVTI